MNSKKEIVFAMDDVCSGCSGYLYLQNSHLNPNKINQSIGHHTGKDGISQLILKRVTMLAKNLSITVIAEVVETSEQVRRRRRKA